MSRGRGLALLSKIKERQLAEAGQKEKEALIQALKERKKALEESTRSSGETETKPKARGEAEESIKKDETIIKTTLKSPINNLDLSVNFVAIEFENPSASGFIYEYKVKFDDETSDRIRERIKAVERHPEIGKSSAKYFNGNTLILPKRLTILDLNYDEDKFVNFEETRELEMTDPGCLRLFNIILNKSFRSMNLFPVKSPSKERSYFNPNAKHSLVKHKLEVWPGYITSIGNFEAGICLVFDSCSKIIRKETVADALANLFKKNSNRGDFINLAQKQLIGQSVMTSYSNKSYRIHEISFDLSPESTFETGFNSGQHQTYMEYYKNQYGIEIRDKKQPLLIHRMKRSELPDGQEISICLIPELCLLTGLTESQRNDFRVMKEVADFTRLKPTIRKERFDEFLKSLTDNKEAMQHWKEWGLKFANQTLKVKGRLMDQPTLYFGNNYKEQINRGGDWSRAATTKPVLTPIAIDKWAIVVNEANCFQALCNLKQGLETSAKKLGITLKSPKIIKISDDRSETVVKAIREMPSGCELLVAIFGGAQRADRYAALKKICCIEKPMASQVVMQKTLMKDKNLSSVCAKLLLQMNCKRGGELWGIQIPLKSLMVIGIDDGKGVTSVVASLNDTFSKFHSNVIMDKNKDETMQTVFRKALQNFKLMNDNKFPSNIIVFRNGGEYLYERDGLKEFVTQEFPQVTNVALVVIRRRTIVKMMTHSDRKGYENPPAGTVLDKMVTNKNDFFLVPMSVNLGTVNPTHYIVIEAGSIEIDLIQKVAYALSHMYFNWTGTVKIPAPCQYARKLGELTGSHLRGAPSPSLSQTLFYL